MKTTVTTVVVKDSIRANALTVVLFTGTEVFYELLTFFRERCNSLATERLYALALSRFIEWLSVRAPEFHATTQRPEIYTAWAHDLLNGTYKDDENLYGLHWKATTKQNVSRLSRCLLQFSDWLQHRYGITHINPLTGRASYAQQLTFWRKWNKVKAGALLSHTMSTQAFESEAETSRQKKSSFGVNTNTDQPLAFPEDQIDRLLWVGFLRRGIPNSAPLWIRFNLRDILITILCLYGGCRRGEPLHLWVSDVYIDPDVPDCALVRIYDPHDGEVEYTNPVTGVRQETTRADFLRRFCNGRVPLTQEKGRRHVGWKGNFLTEPSQNAFRVIWVDRDAGRLFLSLWQLYVAHVRPLTPQIPWAFLTTDLQPLGSDGFDDSFRAAVRRTGLIPSKLAGTSSQALRHRYGQWLNDLEIDDKSGQIAMHHRNATSQRVYREKTVADVANHMANGILKVYNPKDVS